MLEKKGACTMMAKHLGYGLYIFLYNFIFVDTVCFFFLNTIYQNDDIQMVNDQKWVFDVPFQSVV